MSNLTFIKKTGRDSKGNQLAEYLCICGSVVEKIQTRVKTGHTKSCGCLQKTNLGIRSITHGLSKHPLYKIYLGILARCYDENLPCYKIYGGKGVKVCEEWRNDFKSFFDWAISNGWEKGLEVDKDIKGSRFLYSPNDCLIVTHKENCNKRTTSRFICHNGVEKTIAQLADEYGVRQEMLLSRIKRGWSLEKSLSHEAIERSGMKPIICLNSGERFESMANASFKLGLKMKEISAVCTGRQKTTKGYYFKIID